VPLEIVLAWGFPFNQKFQKFETETNCTEISRENSQKIRNCWISEKRTIQPKIGKWNRTEIPENLGTPREVVLFSCNSENVVPFVSGNFWKFKPNLHRLESARDQVIVSNATLYLHTHHVTLCGVVDGLWPKCRFSTTNN